jgi:lipopolysaccharide/colanic/teichoic acid biosynthesis glycosyltransferase
METIRENPGAFAAAALPRMSAARVLFDRAAAGAGLVFLSPVLLAAAAAIRLDDGPPVFFRQTRIGLGNRPFQLLKFRSMRDGGRGPKITSGGDPRVTRIGRILRKFKLDELPQLWNVVRGDMALVGPRPEVPEYVDPEHPLWRAVLEIRPGVTDLATLLYRNEEEILAGASDPDRYYRDVLLPDKLRLNVRYAQSSSFLRDLKLILLTVRYSFVPAGFNAAAVERAFSTRVL